MCTYWSPYITPSHLYVPLMVLRIFGALHGISMHQWHPNEHGCEFYKLNKDDRALLFIIIGFRITKKLEK